MYFHESGIQEWLAGFAILAVLLIIAWRRKSNHWHLLFLLGFWLYLVVLVDATLFPIPIGGDSWAPVGQQPWQYVLKQVNLIPFQYLIQFDANPGAIFSEILNNVLMTIPFGFGLNFLTHIKPRTILWIAVLTGLGIELAQLSLSLLVGLSYRTVDITDVILNATGTLIGYGCFRIFAWLVRHGLGAYVDEIARQ